MPAPGTSYALVLVLVPLLGCVHFNAVYNAQRLFGQAERLHWRGDAEDHADVYGSIIARAERGLNANPEGPWVDDALLLIGQAHLRRYEYAQARDALQSALERTGDEALRRVATMYLGAVLVAQGEAEAAMPLLEGVEQIRARVPRGEGHLWRARGWLALGRLDRAWSDLDAAVQAHPDFGPPADLLRLGWGVESGDTITAFTGLQALMRNSDARFQGDSVRRILTRAADAWGPQTALRLMSGATDASWSRRERDALLLQRARFARAAGDTALAEQDASRVAGGAGPLADEARVLLAGWRLTQVGQIRGLEEVRGLLLPAIADERARRLANEIRRIEFLVDVGLEGESLAFFAAAEKARESLGALRLAGALFLAFADLDPGSPWAAKALLAARALSTSSERRETIDARLGDLPEGAYHRYARSTEGGEELAGLEERLQSALADILGRVEVTLTERRLLIHDPDGDPLPTIPPPRGPASMTRTTPS